MIFFVLKPIFFLNGIWNPGKLSEFSALGDLLYPYLRQCAIQFILGINSIDGPTWFLVALFWCKIFTDVLKKNPNLWLLFVLLYVVFPLTHHGLLFLRQACQAFPFYFIGFYFKQYCHKIQLISIYSKILLAFSAIGLSIWFTSVNGRVSLYATNYGNYPVYFSIWLFYFNALLGSFSVLSLSACFKENFYIKKIAFALITILGAQEFFINTYRNFCGSNLSFHDLWISLIILVICVLIHQIIEKYLPFVLGKSKKVK